MARPRIRPSSSATRACSTCSSGYRLVTSFPSGNLPSRTLMAEAHWPGQPGVAQLVHLGIANTAREIAHRDLIPTRIRDVDVLDHQRPPILHLYGGLALHDCLLRSIKPCNGKGTEERAVDVCPGRTGRCVRTRANHLPVIGASPSARG